MNHVCRQRGPGHQPQHDRLVRLQGLHDAIKYAVNTKGRIVVARRRQLRRRRQHLPGDQPGRLSGRYDEVIAVGAVGSNDRWASYSEIQSYVDLVAPGGHRRQSHPIHPDERYLRAEAWHIDGLAPRGRPGGPHLGAESISDASASVETMRDSAVKVDSYPYTAGRNDYCGYGRINVAAALARVAPRVSVSPAALSFLAGGNRPSRPIASCSATTAVSTR